MKTTTYSDRIYLLRARQAGAKITYIKGKMVIIWKNAHIAIQ
jgi:hypothetical protein